MSNRPPYQCKFCGMPSWVDPSDQEAPPDYCHESDHGREERYLEELIDAKSILELLKIELLLHNKLKEKNE